MMELACWVVMRYFALHDLWLDSSKAAWSGTFDFGLYWRKSVAFTV